MSSAGDDVETGERDVRKQAPFEKNLGSQAAASKRPAANKTMVKSTAKPPKAVPTERPSVVVIWNYGKRRWPPTSTREEAVPQGKFGMGSASEGMQDTGKSGRTTEDVSNRGPPQASLPTNNPKVAPTTPPTERN